MVTTKITAIWRIVTNKSATLISQKHPGCHIETISYGQGGLRDMYLTALELKQMYNGLLTAIVSAAAEGGELHALTEMKAAIDAMEKL